jgi:hypothetical protein
MTQRARRIARAVVFFVALVVTPTLLELVGHAFGAKPPAWLISVSFPVVGAVFGVVETLLGRREAARQRRLIYPHCVQCGYDLTGNESGTCPECGCVFR